MRKRAPQLLRDTSLDGRSAPASENATKTADVLGVCSVAATIQGTAPLLLHRYDVRAVAHKTSLPKGSLQRKTDDLESYLYRDERGLIGFPGTNIKRCLVQAGRYFDDPRSSGRRKQATELLSATLLIDPDMPLLKVDGLPIEAAEFTDCRRVVIQRQAAARERPGFRAGWRLSFHVTSLDARYVPTTLIRDLLSYAGRFIGIGDYRPDFGRFQVVSAEEDVR